MMIKSAGGKLFIITVPDYFAVVPDWKKSFRQATGLNEPPKDFDPLLAEKNWKLWANKTVSKCRILHRISMTIGFDLT
jgi:hypothetical protein